MEFRERRPVIEQREDPEQREKRQAFQRGLLDRLAVVDQALQELPVPIRSKELGAASLAVVFGTITSGCSHSLEETSCTPDNEAFFSDVIDWVADHPKEIQEEMDTIWPNQRVSATDVVGSVLAAEIACGTAINEKDNEWTMAEAWYQEDPKLLVVNINYEHFERTMQTYQETGYIADLSEEEVLEIMQEDRAESSTLLGDLFNYQLAVSNYVHVIAHEGSHLAIEDGHEKDVSAAALESTSYPGAIDEHYAWGEAARIAHDAYAEDKLQQWNQMRP